ncbi:MAG: sigma-54 dependent transcriptional regulator [Desulfobulbaceae bacterium]
MADILVVDDDVLLCKMLVEHLIRSGHNADGVNTLADGLEQARSGDYDVVFLDVQMPDGNGLEFLPRFKEVKSDPEVIIITGRGDAGGARQAITSGAWSYIEKPHVVRNLLLHLTRALQYREEKKKIAPPPVALKRSGIVGTSDAIAECLDKVAQASASDVSVLITGDTGTGKEVFARAIHENSKRFKGNFVVVDCTAIPENLAESILFGHRKGAFTGADKDHDGLIKHAHGGTLFLDEVGDLPLSIQKTFLRILQERSFRPLGRTELLPSDFRVISATNRDLEEMVEKGEFRQDLYYRLKGMSIHLPPLRERSGDIRELVRYYVGELCDRYEVETKGVSQDFLDTLAKYDWPGNVRELFQTLEQAFAAGIRNPTLFSTHLPEHIRIHEAQANLEAEKEQRKRPASTAGRRLAPWKEFRDGVEKKYIQDLLILSGGSMKKACEISELSRSRLYQLLEKHGLRSSPEEVIPGERD